MIRFLVCLLIVFGSIEHVHAQWPQYYLTNYGPAYTGNIGCGCYTFGAVPQSTHGGKLQSVFLPADFPTAPSGMITNLYIRVGAAIPHGQTSIFYNFTLKIGNTGKTKFNTNNGTVNDTFVTNLTTVVSSSAYTMKGADTLGKWIKIPFTEGNFYYDKKKNFVVEMAFGPPSPQYGFLILSSTFTNGPRCLGGDRDSVVSSESGARPVDLGFDIMTTVVNDVSNIISFGLFPNPGDGRFNITFDTKQSVSEVSVSITNVTGQQVYQQQYHNIGSSFFKEVDLHEAARGVYFVEVMAGGERVVRRVIIQ